MSTVSIEIDSKGAKRSRSPLYRWVLSFRGVATTSAPIFLYGAGRGWFHKYDYLAAALCFAIIYLVGWFYVLLGNEVIGQLRNEKPYLEEEKARWVRLFFLWVAVLALVVIVWAAFAFWFSPGPSAQ
jgi:uncharacterized membrane protein